MTVLGILLTAFLFAWQTFSTIRAYFHHTVHKLTFTSHWKLDNWLYQPANLLPAAYLISQPSELDLSLSVNACQSTATDGVHVTDFGVDSLSHFFHRQTQTRLITAPCLGYCRYGWYW